MTYKELLIQISKNKFSPTYFLNGKEDYLLEDALNRLMEALCDPATKDFDLETFYGSEVDGIRIINAANAYPMMATDRVVVVKEVHKLTPTSFEQLTRYLEKPSSTTKLILISNKVDSRNKIISKIRTKSCWVECNPLYDREIPEWIRVHLKVKGYDITREAILMLQTRVGNNLRVIVNELDKIILNLNGRKKIIDSDVQKLVGYSRDYSIFDLTDAIGYKELSKSLSILNRMLQYGESPTVILGMITRHFISLVKVKGAIAQTKSQDEISQLTGIPSFVIKKMKKMSGNYPTSQFNKIFEYLLDTDVSLKTSSQKPKFALETLLVRILKIN